MKIERQVFGETAEDIRVDLHTLTNGRGMKARITNYGGILVSLEVPDRHGRMDDIVLGYDDLESYERDTSYLGSTIGRYANRIAKGRFTLGDVSYQLAQNNGGNHLHGGERGFHKVVWAADEIETDDGVGLRLNYVSRDGEEGYPGNLTVAVTHTLTDENELKIEYAATTDEATIINLTNHSYFNLAGQGAGTVLDHEVKINAARFTPIDSTFIPTGELREVSNTPFDFTRPTAIGARIEDEFEQLIFGGGYDHNFVLDKQEGAFVLAVEVYEPMTGRVMQISTTEPGLQFYTGNFLEHLKGKGGRTYRKRDGLCLETQHFPDSPNKPDFPSVVLRPGARYTHTTVYKFSVKGLTETP